MQDGNATISTSYDISLVIPVYNGSGLLEKHLTPLLSWLNDKPYRTQVILVDDGSPDCHLTMTYARKHGLQFLGLKKNNGKGAALRYGFRLAEGNIQLFTDADIPFQYENIDAFISLSRQNPEKLIIGDRTDPSSVYFEKTGLIRTAGSNLVSALVSRFFAKGVRDTQCGLKGMGKDVARLLFRHSRINRFAIDVELVYLARKNDIPIMKIPVQLRYNDKSSINAIKDGLKLLSDLYRIRKIHGKRNTVRRTGDKISIRGNYQYNAYYKGSALQRCWHRFKISAAIKNLDLKPGQSLLDAGCGSGMLPALVAKDNPSIQITAIDGNTDAIAFCTEQWKQLTNIHFIESPIDELQQFSDAGFDGITFLEVIEHITEQQAAHVLAEFNRMLKPGGLLVVSTPNRKSLWPLLEYIMDKFRLAPKLKNDQHEKLYSGAELAEIAEQNGFIVTGKQRVNFIAPWIGLISEKYAAKVHLWEMNQNRTPGSLLLYTFTKP